MRDTEIQLFARNGMLIDTVSIPHVEGKLPLIVFFGPEMYVLVDGRYVIANAVQATPLRAT